MFGQLFEIGDVPTVITLIFLEGLLSADNALVLAILVQALPKNQQQRGLMYGLVGAFVLRAGSILLASTLMKYWWIEAVGAAYLLYLAIKHFVSKAGEDAHAATKVRGFWATIVVVELTDLAFAVDSILAAVALVGSRQEKLWVIYLGGILGVIMMRFVANFFLQLLGRFSRLETSAYLIIAWISAKLGISAYGHYCETQHIEALIHHMPYALFWPVTLALFAFGFTKRNRVVAQSTDGNPDA
ncbi:MAG: TerC family protein [Candidatus Poribacteria bacterium]|nr:TerC family protein [Candidatus Poribacteria bacterium]